jgi:hypothetical protein
VLRVLLIAVLALLAAPATALAGGPSMLLGATEDAVRSSNPTVAQQQMDLLAAAGFDSVRVTQTWTPGQSKLSTADAIVLGNVFAAAKKDGITVLVTVMNFGSRTTPLTDADQSDFAAYAASVVKTVGAQYVIVGNEPNLNRYWLPQFGPDGADVAASAYETLLARTYDAVKAVDPNALVIGGALSPRGGDVPGTGRDTHSPTQFITDLGAAYRASERAQPIMDGLALHPYEDHSSVAPIDGTHPGTTTIAVADYGKLVALLGEAFDGTAQTGSTLPIYFDEFGVESQIPAAKQSLYTGSEVAVTEPVDEATQAAYYKQAIQLAFCQPTVRGFFLFHAVDETSMPAWQSGVYYADDTPKASLAGVRLALEQARRGVVAKCPALALTPKPKVVQTGKVLTLTCDIDCSFVAQLYRLPGHLLVSTRGHAVGGRPTQLTIRAPSKRGTYRLRLSAIAPLNPGPAALVRVAIRPG